MYSRRSQYKWAVRAWMLTGIVVFTVWTNWQYFGESDGLNVEGPLNIDGKTLSKDGTYGFASRQLLAAAPPPSWNCTPPAIEQFPRTLLTPAQRRQGGVVIHILVAAYMFLALAIACDDYFVPACESLCSSLNLKPDVAGATFMAAGSSAPELATAVIGVFVAKDDIGLGAVVGSAVFNIMFVISVCSLFAGAVVHLNWWPLCRDCLYYTLSIMALVLVITDGQVKWYEALILLLLYISYIVLMFFNPKLEVWLVPKVTCLGGRTPKDNEDDSILNKKPDEYNTKNGDALHMISDETESETENPAAEMELHSLLLPEEGSKNHTNGSLKDGLAVSVKQSSEDGEESVLDFPDSCIKRIIWLVGLPLTLIMFITVPDCRKKRWKKWFVLTFAISIIWIAIFSYIMVWMITVAGYTFGVPDTVMGLTFIAAGASIPDAIASLLVARDGYGDMAVSNAVGSNVFDILLCLGLPWFIKTVIYEPDSSVEVYSSGLQYSALTLLSTVIFLLVATHLNGWKLDIKYGIILMIVYVLFTVLSILYELNIFGYLHPPECSSDY